MTAFADLTMFARDRDNSTNNLIKERKTGQQELSEEDLLDRNAV
jgi:hypothetical protein